MVLGLPCTVWGNLLESGSPDFGDKGILDSMILRQDLRLLAQSKEQKSKTQDGAVPQEVAPEDNPFEEVDSKTGKSLDIEQRLPNVKTKTEPKDMLARVGGMPLEVPRELDIGRTPQMRAKLPRQQLLNPFNPAIGFVFELVFSYKQQVQAFNNGDETVGNADGPRTDVRTWSPYLAFYPSEFHRIILECEYSSYGIATGANGVFFQWEVVISSHQHGFTERD